MPHPGERGVDIRTVNGFSKVKYFQWMCGRMENCHYLKVWTRNRQGVGSTLTWSTASNLEQVANLLFVQANSASHPQRDGK